MMFRHTDDKPCCVCKAKKGEFHLVMPPLSNRRYFLILAGQWLLLALVGLAVLATVALEALKVRLP